MRDTSVRERTDIGGGIVLMRRAGRVQRAANRTAAIDAINGILMRNFPKWDVDEELLEEALFDDRKPWKHEQLTRAAKELVKTSKYTPKLVELLQALDKIIKSDLDEIKKKSQEKRLRVPDEEDRDLPVHEPSPALTRQATDVDQQSGVTFEELRNRSERLIAEWLPVGNGRYWHWTELGRIVWGNQRWLELIEGDYLNISKIREIGGLLLEDYHNGIRCSVEMPDDEAIEAAEVLVMKVTAYEEKPLYVGLDDF